MERIVVYGLGKEYIRQRFILEREYIIVGVSDKNTELRKQYSNYVEPERIDEIQYDYVYVTSQQYYEEIKTELCVNYAIPTEKIIGINDSWWNVANDNTRSEWIIKQLSIIPNGSKLLDAGAGNQRYKQFCSHLQYISQDFGEFDSQDNTEGIKGGEKWRSMECDIISDIINIPVDDDSFDAILCSEVLEHIKNPVLAIQEFSRIIKSGGELILTAPFCSLTHMAPFYYSNGFSKYWYKDILEESGFGITEIVANGNYFSYMAQELIRTIEIAERYGGKELSSNDCSVLFESIKLMMNQSKITEESEETLCFGYFVKATRR